jgi:hypothetical protein
VSGDDELAGQALEPGLGHHGQRRGARIEPFAPGDAAEEGVAGELVVEFPLELEVAEVDQAVGTGGVDGPAEELAQGNQVLLGGAGRLALVEQGEVADELRALQRHRGAGVELVVEGLALVVLGEVVGQCHGIGRARRLARGDRGLHLAVTEGGWQGR